MATLLIGYDVEAQESEITERFLKKAGEVHRTLKVPCTMFLVGKTLEKNINNCQDLTKNELIDFQQHTYSHMLLKTVVMERQGTIELFKGANLSQIEEEIKKTNGLTKKYLDVECIGLRGPYGYYRGLSDRPDILEILYNLGIRFTSTYARDKKDFQPVDFEVQPFWYSPQGFDDMLEVPVQGWQDVYLRAKYGWTNLDAYLKHIKKELDYIFEHNLVWGYCQHDSSSIRDDSDMSMTRQIIEYALKKGVSIISYLDYYKKMAKSNKSQIALSMRLSELWRVELD